MKYRLALLLLAAALLLFFTGCGSQASTAPSETNSQAEVDTEEQMRIQILGEGGETVIFQLNNSSAARGLYEQLPLSTKVENFSNNEKIFYPPDELDIRDTPLAEGPVGTLAYYAPWGDVAVFYGECGGAGGLYELGEAVSGTEQIESLTGEIKIEAVSE